MKIGLVSCSGPKLGVPTYAFGLYRSQLFRAAADYCDRNYDEWFILSGLHGLVERMTVIAPYNVDLTKMSWLDRQKWGTNVLIQMGFVIPRSYTNPPTLYVHAGRLYRDAIPFEVGGWNDVQVPLEGLGIGQQLGWYKRAANSTAR